jgi:hypothetical protein
MSNSNNDLSNCRRLLALLDSCFKGAVFGDVKVADLSHSLLQVIELATPTAHLAPTVQETVAWVLLREDEDGFEPIQFYGGKEKPETAAGELKPRFTLRPVCFADTIRARK